MVWHRCPLLALSGHRFVQRQCPLFGGKADMTFCGANVCFPKADIDGPLLRHHPSRGRGLFSGGGNSERKPRIPALGTVLCAKLFVGFQVQVTLHISDWKEVSNLWPDTKYARFEIT